MPTVRTVSYTVHNVIGNKTRRLKMTLLEEFEDAMLIRLVCIFDIKDLLEHKEEILQQIRYEIGAYYGDTK